MLLFLGKSLLNFFGEVGLLLGLLSRIIALIFKGKLHWRNFMQQIVYLGYNSTGIILITAFFIGMVFSMQITKEFLKYGAGSVVGGVIGIAIWRELAPVLTAVIIAGRVGSAITAELGSMKVTEQVDAITSFGIDADYYLVAPKVVALSLMMPFLVLFFDVIGLLGSYFMSVNIMGLNPVLFITSVNELVDIKDLGGGLVKALIFGVVISAVASRQGLATEGGSLGVGNATTRAVVISLLSVFVINYFLSAIIF